MTTFTLEQMIARSAAGASSVRLYEYQLGQVEKWIGGPLGDASERDLLALKKKLRGMTSGPQYAKLVRMFYRDAYKATKEPRYADAADLFKLKQRMKRLAPSDILTPEDVQRMIDATDPTRDRALLGLLWETGVRIHELLALDLADVREGESPENGGRKMYALWFKKTKVAGEEHVGYVIEAAPLLQTWLRAHPNARDASGPLFPSVEGGRLTPDGAAFVVKRAGRRAGLEKRVYCHLFRHSRATYLLAVGMKEIDVKRLLGWVPGSPLLEQKYAHLSTGQTKAAYLKALGLQAPETVDLGKLSFPDETLHPLVPVNVRPGASAPVSPREFQELLSDPDVQKWVANPLTQKLLRLLEGVQSQPPV